MLTVHGRGWEMGGKEKWGDRKRGIRRGEWGKVSTYIDGM